MKVESNEKVEKSFLPLQDCRGYSNIEKIYITLQKNSFLRDFANKLFIIYYYLGFFKAIEAKILSTFLDISGDEKVLNVACGLGPHNIKIAKSGCEVYGVDINSGKITIAKGFSARYSINLILGDAEKLPFKPRSFDKVLSVCALEHFQNDEKALEEMSRTLKPGGILVLSLDSFTYKGIKKHVLEKHRINNYVVNYYSISSIAEKLDKAGFELVESRYFINSPVSSFFYTFFIRFRSRFHIALFPISYSLSVLSDWLFGRKEGGYALAIKAKKKPDIR